MSKSKSRVAGRIRARRMEDFLINRMGKQEKVYAIRHPQTGEYLSGGGKWVLRRDGVGFVQLDEAVAFAKDKVGAAEIIEEIGVRR